MLIYTPQITPRLQYIIAIAAEAISGDRWHITTDITEYTRHTGPRINYSVSPLPGDSFHIIPHSLLFETDIREQNPVCYTTNDFPILFPGEGDWPFDVFAASFWLLTRYEEYMPHQNDVYGRYAHENSFAFREGFLNRPLVNEWFRKLGVELKQRMPEMVLAEHKFSFMPTYDIDIAWSYLNKGIVRNVSGSLRSLFTLDFKAFTERWRVLAYDLPDPYDAYGWLDELHKDTELKPLYFFLVARNNGKYDRNILPTRSQLRALIKLHSLKYTTGLHPSWKSGDKPGFLFYEKNFMEAVTGDKIRHSRQHYIRMNLPDTYRQLVSAGISHDYSMGYGSINGFRASFASSFPWYDLGKERVTNLQIHPFCFMDANSYYEQKMSPEAALEEMRHYLEITKAVRGTLITIWHNHFLGTSPQFTAWRDVYNRFVSEVAALES